LANPIGSNTKLDAMYILIYKMSLALHQGR
jgi:hypothetical protein